MVKRVLLVSMPDAALSFDRTVKLPNLGLCSIAGNLGRFDVHILDLVLHNKNAARVLKDVVKNINPDVVGISSMSFQYNSALKAAKIIRGLLPSCKLVLGGYHSTLAPDELIKDKDNPFDYLILSEGEESFRMLCEAIDSGNGFDRIPGIYYKKRKEYIKTPPSKLLDVSKIKLPDRKARLSSGYHLLGKRFDCIETSRGCLMGCSFCSIHGMYGKNFRMYPIDRVLEDIDFIYGTGVEGIFVVDDNVTMEVNRFRELLEKIIEHRLNRLDYVIQASVSGIVKSEDLPELMKEAGIRIVFLGIENNNIENLKKLKKSHNMEMTYKVVDRLKKNGIIVFGGFIVANPEDDQERIKSTFRYIKSLNLDHAIVQCLTPYPGTEIRRELLSRGLIDNVEDYSNYNGFTCNIHTMYLSRKDINKLLLKEGFKYYFNPKYRGSSQFLRNYKNMLPKLIMNDFSFIYGTLKGNIFPSRHKWR